MAKNKKKIITEIMSHGNIPLEDFAGKIQDVIDWVQDCRDNILERKNYSNIRLVLMDDDDNYAPCFIIEADRLETDDEYNKRIKIENIIKKEKREEEKEHQQEEIKLYKQLRDKYGDI